MFTTSSAPNPRQNRKCFALLVTVLALPWAAGLRPSAVVYDCMDDLTGFRNAPRLLREREASLLAAADVVFTSLPGPPEVETVAFGDTGLIHGVRAGSALFDLSTNSPALIRRMGAAFQAKGAHVLDAPVSGGPVGARTRKLAIWVGGDRAIFDRHKALLDAMGDQPYYVGPIGAGASESRSDQVMRGLRSAGARTPPPPRSRRAPRAVRCRARR